MKVFSEVPEQYQNPGGDYWKWGTWAEGIFQGTQTHGSQPCLWLQDQGNKSIDQGLVEIMGQDEWFPGDFFGIPIGRVIPKCSAQTTINHIQSSISRCPGEGFDKAVHKQPVFFFVPHGSAAVSTVHASIWPYLPPPVFFHRPSASIHRKLHPRVELLFQALQTGVKHAGLPLTTADSLMEPAKYVMKTNVLKSHGKKTRIITDHMQRVCRNSTF